jgi:hypothetical protein
MNDPDLRPGMFESEALKRWCPFARVSPNGLVAINRDEVGAARDCYCIASQCLAWRGLGEFLDRKKGHYEPRGYCGLAGTPEHLTT